jgi:hypothetical protein
LLLSKLFLFKESFLKIIFHPHYIYEPTGLIGGQEKLPSPLWGEGGVSSPLTGEDQVENPVL